MPVPDVGSFQPNRLVKGVGFFSSLHCSAVVVEANSCDFALPNLSVTFHGFVVPHPLKYHYVFLYKTVQVDFGTRDSSLRRRGSLAFYRLLDTTRIR
jgi:hypothetical protein